jgi:DnaJ-domain-containing protein 1
MYGISSQMDKIKIDAQVELHSGNQFLAAFFVRRDQRISDLLNDEREFLPLELTNGLISHLKKSSIASVTQLDQRVDDDSEQDPYLVLGVRSNATDDEVRATYHRRVQNYHPDRIQAIGLPGEFVDLANTQMARINGAYERIIEARKA